MIIKIFSLKKKGIEILNNLYENNEDDKLHEECGVFGVYNHPDAAALTALALFAAYVTMTGIHGINIFKADVLATLFVGAMVPVVLSALAMNSVGKAAMEMVKEVRR